MTDFDLIIFDCDGVVVDSETLSCGCLRALLAEHGVEIALDEIYARFLGRSFAAVAEQYPRWRGQPIPADFQPRLERAVEEAFTAALRPMPGIAALLEALRTPYCLASSSGPQRILHSLAVTGLAGFFDGRVFSAAMVPRGKPAPDLFLHAAAAMRAEPRRTLVVEDTEAGIAAGKAAGMMVWGFTGGSHFVGRDGPRLLGASGADRIFDTMADLKQRLAG